MHPASWYGEMLEPVRKASNRRKQADWIVKIAAVLSVTSWIITFSVLIVLDLARPERDNVFTRGSLWGIGGGGTEPTWNETLLPIALIMLIVSFLCCLAAFIFNLMRMRRMTDKYRKSVIIMGFISLIGILIFMIRFGSELF